MNISDFIKSRVEMTVTQYCQTYLSENDRDSFKDAIKIHVYADGMPISQLPNDQYHVLIERSEYVDTLHGCELILWEEFAQEELKDRYNK